MDFDGITGSEFWVVSIRRLFNQIIDEIGSHDGFPSKKDARRR